LYRPNLGKHKCQQSTYKADEIQMPVGHHGGDIYGRMLVMMLGNVQ
jgi:hypothetical protein